MNQTSSWPVTWRRSTQSRGPVDQLVYQTYGRVHRAILSEPFCQSRSTFQLTHLLTPLGRNPHTAGPGASAFSLFDGRQAIEILLRRNGFSIS